MKFIADTHTHTVASTHALSTILENAKIASERGLKYLAITDHAPKMVDAPHRWHFYTMSRVPDELYGVKILKGAEANILNSKGEIDLTEDMLEGLDWIVSSMHYEPWEEDFCSEYFERAYLNICKNPKVDVIGHMGSEDFVCDYAKMIKNFKEYNKLVEINESSLSSGGVWLSNTVEVIKICKKIGAKVVVDSDAHFCYEVGNFPIADKILTELEFPQNLVVNTDVALLEEHINNRL